MEKYSFFIAFIGISTIIYLINLIRVKRKYGWDGFLLTLGPDVFRLLRYGLFLVWLMSVAIIFMSPIVLIFKIILLAVLSIVGIGIWLLF